MSNVNSMLSESYHADRIRVYASALVVVYLNFLSCPVVVFLRRKIDEKSRENQQAGEAQDGGQQAPKSILTLLKGNRGVIIRSLVILQTYLFLACSLAIFAIAHTFGKAQQCNDRFVVSLFHPFPVLPTSRRVLLGIFSVAIIVYSGRYVILIGKAARHRWAKKSGGGQDSGDAGSSKTSKGKMEEFFDKWFVATVVGLIVLSALHVTNTELLKLYNERRTSKVDNSWSFGQVSQGNRLVFLAYLSPRSYRCFWRRIPFGRLSAIFASFVAIIKRQFPPIQTRMESTREIRIYYAKRSD